MVRGRMRSTTILMRIRSKRRDNDNFMKVIPLSSFFLQVELQAQVS
jgi:hypothetical protein